MHISLTATGGLGRLVVPRRPDIAIRLTPVVAALVGTAVTATVGVDWIELIRPVPLAAGGVALVAGAQSRRGR
jgi:hypothetical protein